MERSEGEISNMSNTDDDYDDDVDDESDDNYDEEDLEYSVSAVLRPLLKHDVQLGSPSTCRQKSPQQIKNANLQKLGEKPNRGKAGQNKCPENEVRSRLAQLAYPGLTATDSNLDRGEYLPNVSTFIKEARNRFQN